MLAVGTSSAGAPELHSFIPHNGRQSVMQAGLLSLSSRKSTDISLVTTDGDKVTISAKSALQAGFVGYDYRGQLHGNEVSLRGRALQVSAENAFALSIEGDLSEEELADINKLVAKIEKLGADFFSQPLETSLSQTLELGDVDSIASFAANLRYEQQLSVAHVAREEVEAFPTSRAVSGRPDPQAVSTESVQNFIKKLLDAAKDSKLEAEKIAEKLPQFLSKLFKRLAKEFALDEPKLKLADYIRQQVTHGLKQLTEQMPALNQTT